VRDTSRPVPFARAARAMFDLALDGMVWSRRSVLIALLMGLPVVLAVVYRAFLVSRIASQVGPHDLYGWLVVVYYLRFAVPIAALFYATALVADEVDGKTLTYLLTRPVRREAILAGKFAAYVATTLSLALPAVVLTFFILMTARGRAGLGGAVPDLLRDLGVLALALLAYGALFTLMGVLLKRPVIPGLLFLFIWEFMANLPGYLPRFTLTAYLRSLIRHRPAEEGVSEIFGQVLPAALSLEVLAGAVLVFLAAAAWIFSTREYVMDQ
jgi:ABC-2 type transport system permease protein